MTAVNFTRIEKIGLVLEAHTYRLKSIVTLLKSNEGELSARIIGDLVDSKLLPFEIPGDTSRIDFPGSSQNGLQVCAVALIVAKAFSYSSAGMHVDIFDGVSKCAARKVFNVLVKADERAYLSTVFGSTERMGSHEQGKSLFALHFESKSIDGGKQIFCKSKIDTYLNVGHKWLHEPDEIIAFADEYIQHYDVAAKSGSFDIKKSRDVFTEPSPMHQLPPKRYSKFIEREELSSLKKAILSDEDHIIVCGPPGIGKRTLVQEVLRRIYCGKFGSEFNFDRVSWLNFSNSEELQSDEQVLLAIARDLSVTGALQNRADDVKKLLIEAMQQHHPIIVFDGIDSIADGRIMDLIASSWYGWKIVIITNDGNSMIQKFGREELLLKVKKLSNNASRELLYCIIERTEGLDAKNLKNVVDRIVDQIDGHPLLLRNALETSRGNPELVMKTKDLEAVWSNSWLLLEGAERSMLYCLSISPGGLPASALSDILNIDAESLSSSVNRLDRLGFVDMDREQYGTKDFRWFVQGSAREYIKSVFYELDPQARDSVIKPWMEYFVAQTEDLRFNWSAVSEYRALDYNQQLVNCRCAIKVAMEFDLTKQAMTLSKNIIYYSYTRGDMLLGEFCPLSVWLTVAEDTGDKSEQYEALICKLNIVSKYQRNDEALVALDALNNFLLLNKRTNFSNDLNHWHIHSEALYESQLGDSSKAVVLWTGLLRKRLNPKRRSAVSRWLAACYLDLGKIEKAKILLQKEMKLAEDEGYVRPKISAMISLAKIELKTSNLQDDGETLSDMITVAEELNAEAGDGLYAAELVLMKSAVLDAKGAAQEEVEALKLKAQQQFLSMGYVSKAKNIC